MINKVSIIIADYFFENKLIEKKDIEIYVYGLHLIISSIIGIIIILLIGLLIGRFIDSVIFLVCFILLRNYSGGYHANSYLRCNLYFTGVFLITDLVINFTPAGLIDSMSVIFVCTSFCILFIYAPMDNENKKLDKMQKVKNRKLTLIIFFILTVIAVSSKINDIYYHYNIIVTIFFVAILMVIQIIKERNENEKIKKFVIDKYS